MSRYDVCLAALFPVEGGYNDRKADKGGPTNLGISLRFARGAGKSFNFDLDGDGDVDKEDIKLLKPEHARLIYKILFWDEAGCGRLPAPIDSMVFDQAVNAGPGTAVRLLQRAINRLNGPDKPQLVEDGQPGPKTQSAAAMASLNREGIIKAFREVVIARYRAIAANDPSQKANLNGWINRANKLGTV